MIFLVILFPDQVPVFQTILSPRRRESIISREYCSGYSPGDAELTDGTPGDFAGRVGASLRQALRGYILFFPSLIVLMVLSLLATKIIGLPYQPHQLVQPLLEAGESSLLWPLLVSPF